MFEGAGRVKEEGRGRKEEERGREGEQAGGGAHLPQSTPPLMILTVLTFSTFEGLAWFSYLSQFHIYYTSRKKN